MHPFVTQQLQVVAIVFLLHIAGALKTCDYDTFNERITCDGTTYRCIEGDFCDKKNKIKEVIIDGCNLKALKSGDLFFVNVRAVHIQCENISEIAANAFNDLFHLETLLIGKTQIAAVPVQAFDYIRLRILDLSNNRLEFLQRQHFRGQRHLKQLNLSGNRQLQVYRYTFRDLVNLEELYIGYTNIALPHTFHLKGLLVLDASATRIASFPSYIGEYLSKLMQLNIGYNEISEFDVDAFDHFTELRVLILGGNLVNEINCGLFKKLRYIEELLLFNMNLQDLPDNLFEYNKKLRILNLARNKLESFENDTFFAHNSEMEAIDLSYNKLDALPRQLFASLHKLRSINLAHNRFTRLDFNLFALESLVDVNLQANRLFVLDISTFAKHPQNNIEQLNVMHNKLIFLDNRMLNDMKQLKRLLFNGNILDCHCMNRLILYLNANSIDYGDYGDNFCFDDMVVDASCLNSKYQSKQLRTMAAKYSLNTTFSDKARLDVAKYFSISTRSALYYKGKFD